MAAAAALRANDPDAFMGLVLEGIEELRVTEVEILLLNFWLNQKLRSQMPSYDR